jgi:hypothetical protein
MDIRVPLLAAVVLSGAVSACASSTRTGTQAVTGAPSVVTGMPSTGTVTPTIVTGMPSTVAATQPPGSLAPSFAPPTAILGRDADNGHTVTLRVGQRLDVQLASTYWQIDPPAAPDILHQVGQPSVAASPPSYSGCVPGEGCGTVTATFIAVGVGQTAVTASRTSCGEARGCTGGEGSYRLVVVVDR